MKRAKAAGCTIVSRKTKRVLLVRRSQYVPKPYLWSIPAGSIDKGESPIHAALREVHEEVGFDGQMSVVFEQQDGGFVNFVCEVDREFRPRLNIENDDAGWFALDDLPSPLFPGLKRFLSRLSTW